MGGFIMRKILMLLSFILLISITEPVSIAGENEIPRPTKETHII